MLYYKIMIYIILMILTATSCRIYSVDAKTCVINSLKRIPPPTPPKTRVNFNAIKENADNGSIVLKSCGPPGTPDLQYSYTPNRITPETRLVNLDMKVELTADVSGGIADLSFYLYPDLPPVHFQGSFDCSTLPADIPCPFPMQKHEWLFANVTCRNKYFLREGAFRLNATITNYNEQIAICLEGVLNIYPSWSVNEQK